MKTQFDLQFWAKTEGTNSVMSVATHLGSNKLRIYDKRRAPGTSRKASAPAAFDVSEGHNSNYR